jgi:hypothetical protein
VKKRKLEMAGHLDCSRCPVAIHSRCLSLPQYRGQGLATSACPMHKCTLCHRSASSAGGLILRCVRCTVCLCWDCVEDYELLRRFRPEDTCQDWEGRGFELPVNFEYMTCPNCM